MSGPDDSKLTPTRFLMTDENRGINPEANINIGRRLKDERYKATRQHSDRKAVRHKVLRHVKVGMSKGMNWLDGTIVDISESGAKIVAPESMMLPNQIVIYDPERGHLVLCDVVRRTVDHVGVRFTNVKIGLYPASSPLFVELTLKQGFTMVSKRIAKMASERGK